MLAAARRQRADGSLPQPTGRVVCVLEAKHKTELVGRLKPQTPVGPGKPLSEKDAVVDFVPSDPRAPALLVPRLECPFAFLQNPNAYRDKIFLVRIKKRWNADSARPFGENARCMGQVRAWRGCVGGCVRWCVRGCADAYATHECDPPDP